MNSKKSTDKSVDNKNSKKTIINRKQHRIERSQLNDNVVMTIKILKKAGFEAYIVGGAVRDLILSYRPKDIDIATNAKPEQVRSIFKNSRIIVRRFKLVHVYFKREIIEVATYRAQPDLSINNNSNISSNSHSNFKRNKRGKTTKEPEHVTINGQIIRDNIYGNIDQDVWRRDFTMNALYYDPIEDIIIDYCDGYSALKNHSIKMIGSPDVRYREDPVRILRALRFAAKLDFKIEKETNSPIKKQEYINLLDNVPPARLYEEYNKLFITGHGEKSFLVLNKYNLFNRLFPLTATKQVIKQHHEHINFLHRVLKSTDDRILNSLPVNPAFLIAAFLWHPMLIEYDRLKAESDDHINYIWQQAGINIIKKQNSCLAIPKRFTKVIEEIWWLQKLFTKNTPKAIKAAAYHPKFRAGFDFMLLRADVEPLDEDIVSFWCKYEAADHSVRKTILDNHVK